MENYINNMFGNLINQKNIVFQQIDMNEEELIKNSFFNSNNDSLLRELKKIENFNKIESGYLDNGIPFIILLGSNDNIYLVSEQLVVKIPMIKSNDGKFYGKTWFNKKDGFVLGTDELSYISENETIRNSVYTSEISPNHDSGNLANALKFVEASEVFGQIPQYENYSEVNAFLSEGRKVIVTESSQAFYDDTKQNFIELYCLWDNIESLEKNGKPMVIAGRMHFLEPNRKAERFISFVKNNDGVYERIIPKHDVYCTSYSDYSEFEKDVQIHGMRPAIGENSVSSMCKAEKEPEIISAIRTHVNLLLYCNKMNISISELKSYIDGINIHKNSYNNEKVRNY